MGYRIDFQVGRNQLEGAFLKRGSFFERGRAFRVKLQGTHWLISLRKEPNRTSETRGTLTTLHRSLNFSSLLPSSIPDLEVTGRPTTRCPQSASCSRSMGCSHPCVGIFRARTSSTWPPPPGRTGSISRVPWRSTRTCSRALSVTDEASLRERNSSSEGRSQMRANGIRTTALDLTLNHAATVVPWSAT